ncbi:MAG: PorP/SprF family type IX secretion system membrane protein [Chitinophagaceae bacterium]
MTKRIKHIILFMLFVAVAQLHTKAQDLHFSQYFQAPLLVNPANTGFNPDYDYRIAANHRNQWANVVTNPYVTSSVWGDVQLFTNKFENSWVGLGGAFFQDAAGTAGLKSTRTYASIAYHQVLGYSSLLSIGFSAGWVNKRIDFSKLTFDNQWNGRFFDINQPSNEVFATNQVNYADINVGVNYGWFISEKAYLNLGVSMQHVNRPFESFFGVSSTVDQRVANRFNFFANANFKIGNEWILNPNVYVSTMRQATEWVVGMNANRNLSDDGYQQLIFGMYYRHTDAIIPMVGYQINDLKLIFNYDVTVSALSAANARRGAYEMSIIKNGIFPSANGKNVKCPTIKF